MKEILFCLTLTVVACFLIVGCADTPEETVLYNKVAALKSGDFVPSDLVKQLSPYMVESVPTYTKYDILFKRGRMVWLCVDTENRVVSVFRRQ